MTKRSTLLSFITALLLNFPGQLLQAQPDYTFQSPVLEAGTDLQVGSVYRFKTAKTGVDARVTVTAITGGITLTAIDETGTGFNEAFQPFIKAAPLSDGYVEFKIDFVNPNTTNPKIQAQVPVTCIAVDGANKGDGYIYEKDQVQLLNGYYYYDFIGMNLQVANRSGWIQGENISGRSYPGIDTVARDVMYTVVNADISTMKIRIGARNTSQTQSEVRYRSVYFKRFAFGEINPLPNRTLIHFSGSENKNAVELKGVLSEGDYYDRIIIEKGSSPNLLNQAAQLKVINTESAKYSFTYFDAEPFDGNNYYRIKLVNSVTRTMETSNILMVKKGVSEKKLELKNTIIQRSYPVVTLQSDKNRDAVLKITDMSGRIITSQNVKLNAGVNNIYTGAPQMPAGYGILILQTDTEIKTNKIAFQ
jgi:hypothetical protein